MSGHVNAEALALCREGLLGKRRTARTEAHVSRCARCAEVDAGLGALPALLALSSVPPMAAELTPRLTGVIAGEARGATRDALPTPPRVARPELRSADARRTYRAPQRRHRGRGP